MSTKRKKLSINDHPFLKEAQQQNEIKLNQFLERLSGSTLTTEEKKVKKDIEMSKETFRKIDKGKEVKVHDQPRKYHAKIVDMSETKKEKKAEKLVRKEGERQLIAAAASGVSVTAEARPEKEPEKERFKDKHQRRMKYQEDSDNGMDDYYEGDADHYEDDDQAKNELANLLGHYRSSKYRNRDKQEIIESKPGDIEREQNYSKIMAMKEDQEEERILREEREKKKRKRIKQMEQVDEEERSYDDDE